MSVAVLGIRHHGPGSARSLLAELEQLRPDAVLIEGPQDANPHIALAADPRMRPPVALLVYAPDEPRVATFAPFASFSPEWVALRWALERQVAVRFIDLPAGVQFAMRERAGVVEPGDGPGVPDAELPPADGLRADPLGELARAAGDEDGERLWDRLVESRRDTQDVFAAVSEAIHAVRDVMPEMDPSTLAREAGMRQGIRQAVAEGHERIAVVCGAWHVAALDTLPTAASDARILRALPKGSKTAAAWVPWTSDRLTMASGYAAGIVSPGWYEHLWSGGEPLGGSWMARVARVFRDEGMDASPAHLVDAGRLADALAAMRGRSAPSLVELNDAVAACLGFGSSLPLAIVHRRLIVGEAIGEIPPDAPAAPLARDLEHETRRLRLRPEAAVRSLDLDLRNATDLARSHLLHRLAVLDISWGALETVRGKSGTFHEVWRLAWRPELSVDLIVASRYGNTIRDAAVARAMEAARAEDALPALTRSVELALLADLPEPVEVAMARMASVAAVAADVPALMEALPPLARVLRYGNVRSSDTGAVRTVVEGMVARTCVGLVAAAASLDDDAAAGFARLVDGVHGAVAMLDEPARRQEWCDALGRLLEHAGLHGLVAGRACRLLLDEGVLDTADATRRMRLATSPGADAADGASWVEGFLRGSGTLLLHDDDLFAAIDGWVTGMPGEAFEDVLPLLRRTIGAFTPPERRSIGERVRSGRSTPGDAGRGIDPARAQLVMPVLARILGVRVDGVEP